MEITQLKCKCGSSNNGDPLWINEYCQDCWERYCSKQWWQVLKKEKTAMLEKIKDIISGWGYCTTTFTCWLEIFDPTVDELGIAVNSENALAGFWYYFLAGEE